MKKRHFGVLIVAVVSALLAAFWATTLREPVQDIDALLPGLEDSINDITGIRLTSSGNTTIATLTRGAASWQLAEKAGYRADSNKVRGMLLAMAQARLLEEKTSNPQYYARLGVEAVDSADAGGIQVELEGLNLPIVIIGDQDTTRDGVYARRVDEQTSWLVSGLISIPVATEEWFDHVAVDLNPARIAEVAITHADGEMLVLSKSTFGQPNFEVANISAGRELKRTNIADSIANVVEDLRIEDVLPLAESSFSTLSVTRASFRAFDGLVLDMELTTEGERRLARFSATTSAEVAARYLAAPIQESEDAASAETALPQPSPKPDLSAVNAEAEQLNTLFSDWVYELRQQDFTQLTQRMTDLLKENS